MKYCLWCIHEHEEPKWITTSLTVEYRGQELPACMAHVILVSIDKVICV